MRNNYKKKGTYSDNNNIYLVDLMFMYVNRNNVKIKYILVSELSDQLKNNDWGDLTPIDVINKGSGYHFKRIMDADLNYPIMIDNNNYIVDGMHRLSKAYMLKMKYIKAYTFDNKLMELFKIGKKKDENWSKEDWEYYESLTKNDIEQLYKDRFNKLYLNKEISCVTCKSKLSNMKRCKICKEKIYCNITCAINDKTHFCTKKDYI